MTEVSINVIAAPCPFCREADPALLVESLVDVEDRVPGHYSISRCRRCELVYLSQRPDDASVPASYTADYHTRTGPKNIFLRALFWIDHYLKMKDFDGKAPRSPSVLEIGCGDGQFLSFLERNLDPSAHFVGLDFRVDDSQLPPGSKIKLTEGSIETAQFNQIFDLVIADDVIEHLPQLTDTLRRIAGFMKNGAIFSGQMPDWGSPWRRWFPRHWQGLQIPRHLIFFEQKTLKNVLESCGFAVEKIRSSYDPGDAALSICNWISDTLHLKTRPRQAWFFLPMLLFFTPFGFIQSVLFRRRCALRFVARKR